MSISSRSVSRWPSILALLLLPALAAVPAVAQTEDAVVQEPDRVVYRKITTMQFGDAFVDGELLRPSGTYTVTRKKLRFRNLIEMRGSFRPEMQRSVGSL